MNQTQCDAYTTDLVKLSDEQLTEEIVKQMATMRENNPRRKGCSYQDKYDDAWACIQCLSQYCKAQGKASLFTAGVDLADKRRDEARANRS